MQTLKVFIVIEGASGKDELRIDGNLETLRAFLSGVGNLEIQDPAPTSSPLAEAQPIPHTRKRKSANANASQPLPA